jgi:hypothetical protein
MSKVRKMVADQYPNSVPAPTSDAAESNMLDFLESNVSMQKKQFIIFCLFAGVLFYVMHLSPVTSVFTGMGLSGHSLFGVMGLALSVLLFVAGKYFSSYF